MSSQILALLQASDCDPKFLLGPADLEVSSMNTTENQFHVKVLGVFCVFGMQVAKTCLELLSSLVSVV